jgi:hypothetical protein
MIRKLLSDRLLKIILYALFGASVGSSVGGAVIPSDTVTTQDEMLIGGALAAGIKHYLERKKE